MTDPTPFRCPGGVLLPSALLMLPTSECAGWVPIALWDVARSEAFTRFGRATVEGLSLCPSLEALLLPR